MTPPNCDVPETVPRRWTLHGLNSGGIFSLTYHGVRVLPRRVSYGIGRLGSAILAHAHPESTDALVDNLRAVFPDATDEQLRRHALDDVPQLHEGRRRLPARRGADSPGEDLFEFDDDAASAFGALHARPRRAAGHRPLRQLGGGWRDDVAPSPTSADGCRHARGEPDGQPDPPGSARPAWDRDDWKCASHSTRPCRFGRRWRRTGLWRCWSIGTWDGTAYLCRFWAVLRSFSGRHS